MSDINVSKSAPAPKSTKSTKAAPKAAKRGKVTPEQVAKLVALLRKPKGTTYKEAAKALGLKPKGDQPHQQPAAQVRAMVRDKVRLVHEIIDGDFNSDRGGQVYHVK